MGMMWFIFSEVMFFAAFFGALFYAAHAVGAVARRPGREGIQQLHPVAGFRSAAGRPTARRTSADAPTRTFSTIPAIGIPALNTAILLTSGLTVTICAPRAARRRSAASSTLFLALTFLLGFTFVGFQAHEYGEAYRQLGLRLSTGIYGSTFFMLTGFHGLHVTVGAIMLLVIWLRVLRGHFTPTRHFAFEAVAWYWHFVDVVWLGLFIFVYWL